jgi:hypothetical protein
MLENMKNKSKVVIEIGTKFKKQLFKEKGWDAEDVTLEIEKAFHNAVHTFLENQITENEDFEREILEIMEDELIEGTDEFSKLGEISISLYQKDFNVTQEKQGKLNTTSEVRKR